MLIFAGIVLVYSGLISIGLISGIGGVVTEVVGYMFFSRVDKANKRMDRYHSERLDAQRFKVLLQSCDSIEEKQKREKSRKIIILTACEKWLKHEEQPENPNE